MTDEAILLWIREGMKVRRSSLRSQWFGHTLDIRAPLTNHQIQRMIANNLLCYVNSKTKLEVKIT